MADPDATRKLRIYRALYRMNRAFAHVVANLDELQVDQFFKHDEPDEDHPARWQDMLGEVQAEINRRVTENMHNLEHGDMSRLSRIVFMAPEHRPGYFDENPRPKKRRPKRKSA